MQKNRITKAGMLRVLKAVKNKIEKEQAALKLNPKHYINVERNHCYICHLLDYYYDLIIPPNHRESKMEHALGIKYNLHKFLEDNAPSESKYEDIYNDETFNSWLHNPLCGSSWWTFREERYIAEVDYDKRADVFNRVFESKIQYIKYLIRDVRNGHALIPKLYYS